MFDLRVRNNNNSFRFIRAGSELYSPDEVLTPFVGEWAHVAATFDGTTARLYLNGEEIQSGAFSFGNKTTAEMRIGDYDGYFMQGWTGTGKYPYEQGRWIWINALRPYYSDLKMRLCSMAAKFILDENGNDTGARPPYAAYGIINRGNDYAYINGDYTSYTINWWGQQVSTRIQRSVG